jgi:cyclophilin family peptidyl-prolyl cis-trans isomerase
MEATKSVKITVAGRLNDPNFHKCWRVAQKLEEDFYGEVTIECLYFFETQWEEYLKKTANRLKDAFYLHKASPLVFLNDRDYIGDAEKFMEWALLTFKVQDDASAKVFDTAAKDFYCKVVNEHKTSKFAFMKFAWADRQEQVVFELFEHIAPRTVANFLQLCNGFKKPDGEALHYTAGEIDRVVRGMFIQAGKLKSAKGGSSIYGGEFADETFAIKHSEVGMLGMCKRGGIKHSNESQFYITTSAPMGFLDGEHVVFGRVIQGMEALREIEMLEATNEKPNDKVRIAGSGSFKAQ